MVEGLGCVAELEVFLQGRLAWCIILDRQRGPERQVHLILLGQAASLSTGLAGGQS